MKIVYASAQGLVGALLLFPAAWIAPAATASPRPGKVEFSDGKTLAGQISLSPGSELKLHVGNQIRVVSLAHVQRLELVPEKETMEQNYRFPEAGKAIKETEGQPYPVRYLAAKVYLAGGETVTGHLYTTVLYVEGAEGAHKVILLAKQRGAEGQTQKDLVYPARISFADAAAEVAWSIRLKLKLPGVAQRAQVAALVSGSLARLEVKSAGPGEYTLASPLGRHVFLAVQSGQKILVGWPGQTDSSLRALVRNAMPNSEDFFDQRQLLGVLRDGASSDVYSLVLAVRRGKTTLEQSRSQPWRLEIYRWKQEEDSRRLMLAGQDYFLRGLEAVGGPVPTVELSEALWNMKQTGEVWVVGEN